MIQYNSVLYIQKMYPFLTKWHGASIIAYNYKVAVIALPKNQIFRICKIEFLKYIITFQSQIEFE